MKFKKYFLVMLGAGVLASCNDIDDQLPQSGTLTASQVQETNEAIPSRVDATFSGMFTMMGVPGACYGSTRADDFGFISAAISQDAEGADFIMADNDYNWFSAACELSTRNANYANPYMRYTMPYRQIGVAQEIINSFPEDTEDPDRHLQNRPGQGHPRFRLHDTRSLLPVQLSDRRRPALRADAERRRGLHQQSPCHGG